jgi:hypothetical protein
VVGVTTGRAPSVRWLLVLVISAGVVAMHSLPMAVGCSDASSMSASSMSASSASGHRPGALGGSHVRAPQPADSSSPAHHGVLGHMCLAVVDPLGVAFLLALLGAALLFVVVVRSAGGPGTARRPRAPPPHRPPSLPSLTELCVSRS